MDQSFLVKHEPNRSPESHGTQSVDRAISILMELAERSPVGQRLADIADATQTSRPTAHRILKRLALSGLVVQERGSHLYKIGPIAHTIDSLGHRNVKLVEDVTPILAGIAQRTGLTTLLVTRHGRFATCCARVNGRDDDHESFAAIGEGSLLGTSAAGIAILAQQQDDEIDEVLYQNRWMIVHFGRLSLDRIWEKISETRKKGYSLSNGDFVGNIMSLSVPVIPLRGHCYMAISVVCATDALRNQVAEVAELMKQRRSAISRFT